MGMWPCRREACEPVRAELCGWEAGLVLSSGFGLTRVAPAPVRSPNGLHTAGSSS